jgi:serine/threonine-protein kinase
MADQKIIGRYQIVAELGRGAMGSVFKATDPAVGRTVAIKTIHSAALQGAQSGEYRTRFQREARASGVLAHPGIVPVFDVGEQEGAPFLVMEFVEGRTLADAMKRGERFTLDRVCEIGQQLAEALGYAHRQGVIHRDIKPANILLTSREVYGAERPRIMDFGIAKLVASEITTTGQMLGTPSFMPPEQFTGAPIDGRADLFSLGVILYALATGEQPFPGESMTAVSYKVVYTEPIPPAKLNPAVPARLEAVILKCLAKSPADRYQTGEDLAQDLAAMRTNAGASTLRTAVPVAAGGTDDTLAATPSAISHPPAQAPASATQEFTSAPTGKPAAKPQIPAAKPGVLAAAFAVVVLAVAAVGGWYFLHHRNQPAPPKQQAATVPAPQPAPNPFAVTPGPAPAAVPAPVPAPVPVPVPTPVTDQGKTPATAPAPAAKPAPQKPGAAKPSTGIPTVAAAKPTPPPAAQTPQPSPAPAPPQPPPVAPNPQPAPAPAAFNPRKLDPNTSGKLKIDVGKFPNGLQFTVMMDKQPYLTFVTGDGASLDNLFVPPGVQSFRVVLKNGGQEFNSNIVSDNFVAKKKRTLKIQLMVQNQVQSKVTAPIDKTATLFLSWSGNIFSSL